MKCAKILLIYKQMIMNLKLSVYKKKTKTFDQKVFQRNNPIIKIQKVKNKEEESKIITKQPRYIKWSIKQKMSDKINSHKNVDEYYAIKELIRQGDFRKVYKVNHQQTGYILYSLQITRNEMYQNDNPYYIIIRGILFEKIKLAYTLTKIEITTYLEQNLFEVSYFCSINIVFQIIIIYKQQQEKRKMDQCKFSQKFIKMERWYCKQGQTCIQKNVIEMKMIYVGELINILESKLKRKV